MRKKLHPKRSESEERARRETILKRLQDRFRHIPADVSLVDELLAERRKETARE